jgi:hypothetical protein
LYIAHCSRQASEAVAKSIQKNLQTVGAERNQSRDPLERDRRRFKKECRKLDDAMNLSLAHWYVVGTLAHRVVTRGWATMFGLHET